MAMEMRLNLEMTQKLVMTPMLQQAIKLLPLAKLELAQLVRQEIIENPILEEDLDDDLEETIDEETSNEQPPDENFSINDEPQSNEDGSSSDQAEDWETYIQNNIDQGLSLESYVNNSIERPSAEATYRKEPTLADHLFWQLNLTVNTDEDKFIGSCIIGNRRDANDRF